MSNKRYPHKDRIAEIIAGIGYVVLIILFCLQVKEAFGEEGVTISYDLPTATESGKQLAVSDIMNIRVYNELDGILKHIKDVPPTQTSTVLNDVYFSCIRLSTVDNMGLEGKLSELDKSKHCFDLPKSPNNITVKIVWTLNTKE